MTEVETLRNGRYLLVERLGEGGMAIVWRAFDQRLQVWRAIKILQPQFATKRKLRSRFESEAQTMALLEHPNIVRVYDVDHDGDTAFIVMEIIEGGSLIDWQERHGRMPERMAVDILVEVCQALDYAHERGVIHRDIKPHNVLIDRKGVCRLTDFGIARAGDDDQGLTKTGAVMGTWGYMAPEQRTDSKHVDRRADVYALAATLYSLITGKAPMDLFAADRDTSILDGVADELVPVLVKATEYRKEARYSTAEEFAAALLSVRDQLPEIPEGTPARAPDLTASRPPPVPRPMDTGERMTLLPSDTFHDQGPIGPVDPIVTVQATMADGDERSVLPQPSSARRWMLLALLVPVGVLVFGLTRSGGGAVPAAPDPVDAPVVVPSEPPVVAPPPPSAPIPVPAAVAPPVVPTTAQPAVVGPSVKSPSVIPPAAPAVVPPVKPAGPEFRPEPPPTAPLPPPEPEPPPPVKLVDVSAPSTVRVGGSAAFRVTTNRPATVVLHYRPVGATGFLKRELVKRADAYNTLVNIDITYKDGLEWFIAVEGVTDGSASRPHRVPVAP